MNAARRRWLGMAAGALAGGVVVERVAFAADRTLTFEIYADNKKEFRWRLKATNGNIIASSGQGYKAKADCKNGIDVIQKGAAAATVVDSTAAAKTK